MAKSPGGGVFFLYNICCQFILILLLLQYERKHSSPRPPSDTVVSLPVSLYCSVFFLVLASGALCLVSFDTADSSLRLWLISSINMSFRLPLSPKILLLLLFITRFIVFFCLICLLSILIEIFCTLYHLLLFNFLTNYSCIVFELVFNDILSFKI